MLKTDFHIHGEYSIDSRMTYTEIIGAALEYDYAAIAITEHLDLLPEEITDERLIPPTAYLAAVRRLQIANPALDVYCGIEIGDYHQVADEVDLVLSGHHFDLKLASVHFLSDRTNVAIPLRQPLTPQQITDYYTQNLALVEQCDFDVLAHLGVYKRYYTQCPDESHVQPIIAEIMRRLIAKGIALEINFSSFRKKYHALLPEIPYLKLYHSLGGRIVSIGSDSHRLDHFDDYYSSAFAVCEHFSFSVINPS